MEPRLFVPRLRESADPEDSDGTDFLSRVPPRPNGPVDPSPGLRPQADALGQQVPAVLRPDGPRDTELKAEQPTPEETLAAFPATAPLLAAKTAVSASPAFRPRGEWIALPPRASAAASALGWALPARWAGGRHRNILNQPRSSLDWAEPEVKRLARELTAQLVRNNDDGSTSAARLTRDRPFPT